MSLQWGRRGPQPQTLVVDQQPRTLEDPNMDPVNVRLVAACPWSSHASALGAYRLDPLAGA